MTEMYACSAWIALWLIGYWCLTLLGFRFLAPLMTTVRQAALSIGTIGLVAALILAEPGERPFLRILLLVIGLAGTLYAVRNQWLVPRDAVELEASKLEPEADALVAILPGGEAVCLSVLSRARTAFRGKTLLVHCGLARSLAAFTRPEGSRPAAILPHATGFDISDGEQRWDGVDGRSLSGGTDLELQPLTLCRYSTWRAAHSLGALLAPIGQGSLPPTHDRKPRVPGAAGVQSPLAWGIVGDKQWEELSEAELAESAETVEPRRYLGRWAALARGLSVESGERGEDDTTADPGNSG